MVSLQNNILAYGQIHPVVTWNGQIVDGRNRWEACRRIGVKAKTKEMEFESESAVISFIVGANLRRRHLTESQRGMITTELAKLALGANQHRNEGAQICASSMTQGQAAELMGVSRRTAQTAKAVAKADPALAAEVKAGNRSLHSAHQEIKRRAAPSKPAAPPTDPDQADDAVIDPKAQAAGRSLMKFLKNASRDELISMQTILRDLRVAIGRRLEELS